jgi:photosystem II stability/assembly factor-like uncharacterized protein
MRLIPCFLPRVPRPDPQRAGGPTLSAVLLLAAAAAFSAVPAAGASEPEPKPSAAATSSASSASPAKTAEAPTAKLIKSLRWREIGPYRGGRSDAVTGIPGDRSTYYFGATGGGVWKTVDAGRSWRPVADGFFGGSIGDVAVSTWDPNVIYAGTGEETVRGNVSEGDGVWKSADAGKSWKHVGLEDSRHVVRLRIHPKNPDLVYAAVLGHLFGPNPMRGVYRSRDGGASWQRVLYVDDQTGAVDLAMDPVNPRVLYAGMWRIRRTPWGFDSGGPGSGLWKTTDGGDTWSELSHNPGLPKGTLGIVGVSVSRTDPENVYAIVEAAGGGVFRSRDGGKTWARTSASHALTQRAWYYSRIYADPADAESVYVVNVSFLHSKDGGRTFTSLRTPHGDNHDLWIAPEDPLRMIEANDGGANISEDGGKTWTAQTNQPTGQIYRIATDNAFPYRVYGAQQDNSALRIRHRTFGGGIGRGDWEETAGGESGYIVPDPADSDVVYGGSYGGLLLRLNHRTHEVRDVNPWPDNPMGHGAADLDYRFQWNFPILFSHDGKTLYAAAQMLLKSTDAGQSWQAISPDLTRNDRDKQVPAGGPITKDNTSVEYYDTIFTVAESPLDTQVLWVGSDDGLVHLSRDGGRSWKNVTPRGLPEWAQINSIEAHSFDKGGAYFAATRYKLDDQRPYLYRTADYGASWTRIDQGIEPTHFTRVVRADPEARGLLYAGTQRGAYVSFDDGGHWQPLQANLPIVPVTDLTVKEGDLVAATEGRAFWSLDDLTPLRELAARGGNPSAEPIHLYAPRIAWRTSGVEGFGGGGGAAGENPPSGAVFFYILKEAAGSRPVKIEILAADGRVIRTFKGKPPAKDGKPKDAEAATKAAAAGRAAEGAAPPGGTKAAAPQAATKAAAPEIAAAEEGAPFPAETAEEEPDPRRRPEPVVAAEAGLNRFAWNLRHEAARSFPGMVLWTGRPDGPPAAPGRYQVRITVGDASATAPFEVRNDPRSSATPEDMQEQAKFLLAIRDKLSQTHDALRRVREVKGQLDDLARRLRAAASAGEADREKAGEPGSEPGGQESLPAAAAVAATPAAAAGSAASKTPSPSSAAAASPSSPTPTTPQTPQTPENRAHEKVLASLKDLSAKLSTVEEALYQTKSRAIEDPLNFPIRLDDKLNGVAGSAALGDRRPTAQDLAVRDRLVAAIDVELAKLDEIWRRDLPAFEELTRSAGVGAVILPLPRLK